MASKKNLILGISTLTVLALGFQNCTQTKFTDATESIEKSSTSPDPVDTDGEIDPRQTESGEVKCESSLVQAAIAYDSVPVSQSAAKSYRNIIPTDIKEEYLSFVGNAAVSNLNITARQVDQVSSLATGTLNINAQKIGFVGNLAASKIHLVGHSVQDPAQLAGNLCVAANRVPSIGRMAGSITVFGRSLNGVKATIDSIGNVAGYLSLYDVDLEVLQNLSTNAKLENVHLKTLQRGAGELILTNSQVDQIDTFAGTIRLRGNSKIGNITQQTAVTVIQE